jgi:hypothetical protein
MRIDSPRAWRIVRAFYFKSPDADMTVDFSAYAKIQPKR